MGECFDIRHSLRHLLQPQHFPDTTLQGEEIASIDLRRAIDLFQLSNSLTFELGNRQTDLFSASHIIHIVVSYFKESLYNSFPGWD